MSPDDDARAIDSKPTKSERKRHSAELQDLGEALVGLPPAELDALPLPDKLRDAVELARRITKRGGLYRQKQYIGKLMRQIDAEPIRAALEARRIRERSRALDFQRLERWRERLLCGGSEALSEFAAAHPHADTRRLRELVAAAHRERSGERAPRAARELFALLREMTAAEDVAD